MSARVFARITHAAAAAVGCACGRTFGEVVRLVVALGLLARLAWVDALQNAYLAEVLERKLQLA